MERPSGVARGLVCPQCNELMMESVGCREDVTILIAGESIAGESLAPVRFGEESVWSEPDEDGDLLEPGVCHDCRAEPGGVHHYLCCVEECPRCGEQLLTCGCTDEPRWVRRWSRRERLRKWLGLR